MEARVQAAARKMAAAQEARKAASEEINKAEQTLEKAKKEPVEAECGRGNEQGMVRRGCRGRELVYSSCAWHTSRSW